jgi:Glutamine amidotransferases class-II.
MCVIVTKPAGSPMPPEDIMKHMWETNSDGAGFAYALNNKVHVEKGFMTYKDLDNALAGLEKRLKSKANLTLDEVSLLVHFRITTHGGTNKELTHPFPITRDTKYMLATDYKADVVLAHNGIISTVVATVQNSDTTQYIRDIIVPMNNSNPRFYTDHNMMEIVEKTINSSRFVFLDKYGEFHFVGNWQTDEDTPGCRYSNLYHKYYVPSKYPAHYLDYGDDFHLYGAPVLVKRIPDTALLAQGSLSGYPKYQSAADLSYDYYIDDYDNIYGTDKDEVDFAWYELYDSVIMNNEEVNYEAIKSNPTKIFVDQYFSGGAPDPVREPDLQDYAQVGTLPKVSKS